MSQFVETTLADGYLDTQRENIRKALNEITNDLGMALRDAGLGNIPIYLVVPNSGDAIATVATPLDPSDEVWSRIMETTYPILQKKIGCGKLRSRPLACATVNEPIAAADVSAE